MMKRAMMTAMLTVCWIEATSADDLAWLDAYNVVWTSQSKNSGGSMPCGGGDIGLNVWVENGDVLFYAGQSGCLDENGAPLKQGRVRISLEPNPFAPGGAEFRQELKLRQSRVEITGQADGAPKTTVRIWVEVHRPVVHVDIDSVRPLSARATFETWRYQDIFLSQKSGKFGQISMAMANRTGFPGKVWLYQDTIEGGQAAVTWFHRMRNDKGIFEYSVRQQGLEAVRGRLYDPLTNLTFGGIMKGEGFRAAGNTKGLHAKTPFKGWRYTSKAPAKRHHVGVYCHIEQAKTLQQWKKHLHDLAGARSPTRAEAWKKNLAWWDEFWNRSHIVINADKADLNDKAWQVGRNYNLFRYQLGCNLSGRQPTLFNGGLFTYDPMYVPSAGGPGYTPDYRRWGAGLWGQNQRLVHWPMLAAGDFDVIVPGLEFYRRGLASSSARVKHYWGHEGCCLSEISSVLALPGCAIWGYPEGGGRGRPKDYEHGVQVNGAVHYLYQAQLEFAYMMLKYHRYSGRDIKSYLPFVDAAVRFYDQHYRMRKKKRDGKELDENGHIVISPSKACEAYNGAVNPADAVAGLHAVLGGLLELPDDLVPPDKKAEYRKMLARVPPIPTAEMDGHKVLAPAANLRTKGCGEIPELYPVFPYDRYGLGRDGLDMAREAWKRTGGNKGYASWQQGGIFCARLGLADQAAGYAIRKLADSGRRFPTFWGPGHDWVPDHNWGGSGMIGLQEMLLQAHSGKIRLLPAWPRTWDVDFKLHASRQTTVEGRVRNGKLLELKVTPESRKKDVVVAGAPPAKAAVTAAGHPAEGKIEPFLSEPKFDMQQVFKNERLPNVLVALDGTVLAFWGCSNVWVRRSEDGGRTWGERITIAKGGFFGGGMTVDETSGDILAFAEDTHPPAPLTVYRSKDHGKTWKAQKTVIHKDCNGNVPSMCMAEHGITLRHGKHKGRLLRPARWYAGGDNGANYPRHYNTAIYSDDGGKTWRTSDPFPAKGTGEGAVAELSDGRIYYNSRRHLDPKGVDPRKRWTAWSYDGGETWKDLAISKVLPDGAGGGCMGGLVRLPIRGKDILIFSNLPGASRPRRDGTAWASFDGGKTWPLKRLVYKGNFAYSSLNAGRPKTKSEGWIYLNFEGGPKGGSTVARFNLSWLLKGEKTGDGELPKWLARYQAPRKKEPAKNK